MPRTARQFEEIREEKKTLIMDVALEHFANEGFHKTTINHIARHAGISKGLMYNYFSSKEELLAEIINRSTSEIYDFFDPDHDGILSDTEFEAFIKKVVSIFSEKKFILRLFFQLLMQKEVRDAIPGDYTTLGSAAVSELQGRELSFIPGLFRMTSEYFERKRKKKGKGYDPSLETTMFFITLEGLAVTIIYSDHDDRELNGKIADRIIAMFK